MAVVTLPFAEYRPDASPIDGAFASVASGVFARGPDSYGPLASLSTFSDALAARCQGAFAARDKAGSVTNFAGDASKLYKLGGAAWSDVSKSGGYALPTDEAWRYEQFGEIVIAATISENPQAWTLGSSTAFADLAGSPPKARHIAVMDPGFVMLGGLENYPNRLRWSAIEDPTDWPTVGTSEAAAKQSDQQDVPVGGWIAGLCGAVGGASGLVFMDTALYRLDYVGGRIIFQISPIDRRRGLVAPDSIVNNGSAAFYLADDGFYACDGQRALPIGASRVDKAFWSEINQTYVHRIVGAADPINKLAIWAVPTQNSANGDPDKLWIYNWQHDRWSTAAIDCETIWRSMTAGYNADNADGLGFDTDTSPFGPDSRFWTGGKLQLSAFDRSHRYATFSGANLAARIETGETDGKNGRRLFARGVRPLVDGGTVTAQIGYRDTPQAAVSYTTATGPGVDGMCPQRIDARFMRARVDIAAGGSWTHAKAAQVDADASGGR
ncbi:MAG: hypothetical protein J0H39_13965 [Alphaproteobacteria bacterium]|nr:hypothetical protein [Alphaproteobacteria bacterium]